MRFLTCFSLKEFHSKTKYCMLHKTTHHPMNNNVADEVRFLTFSLCMLGNFSRCCRLLIFFKINFFKNLFWNTIRVSNNLDPDQDRKNVGPDLGPNCLQRLSADEQRSLLAWKELHCKIICHKISRLSDQTLH